MSGLITYVHISVGNRETDNKCLQGYRPRLLTMLESDLRKLSLARGTRVLLTFLQGFEVVTHWGHDL